MIFFNTLMVFILSFSVLNIIHEGFMFFKALITEENNMTGGRLLGLGLSIAAVISIIYLFICL